MYSKSALSYAFVRVDPFENLPRLQNGKSVLRREIKNHCVHATEDFTAFEKDPGFEENKGLIHEGKALKQDCFR